MFETDSTWSQISQHICSDIAQQCTTITHVRSPLLSCDGAPFSGRLKRWAFHMWTGPEGEISKPCRNHGCHISHTVWTCTALNFKSRSLCGKEAKRSEMIRIYMTNPNKSRQIPNQKEGLRQFKGFWDDESLTETSVGHGLQNWSASQLWPGIRIPARPGTTALCRTWKIWKWTQLRIKWSNPNYIMRGCVSIHQPAAILMFTRGPGFWPIAMFQTPAKNAMRSVSWEHKLTGDSVDVQHTVDYFGPTALLCEE